MDGLSQVGEAGHVRLRRKPQTASYTQRDDALASDVGIVYVCVRPHDSNAAHMRRRARIVAVMD